MRIAFTGTRHLRAMDHSLIQDVVTALPADTELVTGGCVGADFAVALVGFLNGRRVHTVLPANYAQVDPCAVSVATTHEQMPAGTDYRARNQRLVDLADRVIAFPGWQEADPRSRRSGTWLTIRLARQAGKPVELHILRKGG